MIQFDETTNKQAVDFAISKYGPEQTKFHTPQVRGMLQVAAASGIKEARDCCRETIAILECAFKDIEQECGYNDYSLRGRVIAIIKRTLAEVKARGNSCL